RRKAAEDAAQNEQRMNEAFERLAGRIFEERSEKLSQLNEKQLETVLKPLGEQLNDFRRTVAQTHRDETAQNRVLQEKLKQLEQLNVRLHEDATNLTRALTASAKTQGNWGEQQLERLLELAGLQKGREFHTQVSITTSNNQRIQPDLVLSLPEGKAIVMDSKVSLNAWLRYQAEEDEDLRPAHLKAHIQSIRQHVKSLGEKRYAEIDELNALDFVLMFVPIESALIEALQADPELPAFALEHKVALLSPTNLLATLRTVGSVWAIHRQNTNAHEIAGRAGRLYDKFADFVKSLQDIGFRLRQAQESYDTALSRLSTGAGNLLRQAEMLRELGARATKQVDSSLGEDEEFSGETGTSSLKVVHDSSQSGTKKSPAAEDR
ncbi:MAG: DNA recombination protein RmuC, partial [Xanthomonadales bacterium]|nr:DNA recombination protein RmuC [Xanthomonadales bacterium]